MFLEEVSTDVLPPVLPGVCVVVGGGVGDDDVLATGWGLGVPSWMLMILVGHVDSVGRARPYGVSFRCCDFGIPLDGEEEVVAVCR